MVPRRQKRLVLASAISMLALASGCGSAPQAAPKAGPAPLAAPKHSQSPLEHLFPLKDRHTYQYVTRSDKGDGVLLIRVARQSEERGDLILPSGTKRFRFTADGVTLLTERGSVHVLKIPATMGNRWRGEHGGWVEIVAVDSEITVPAGTYQGCLKTIERRGGDRPLTVATTFCPEIGIVRLEAANSAHSELAELKSYGPPVDLGADGTRRLPASPP